MAENAHQTRSAAMSSRFESLEVGSWDYRIVSSSGIRRHDLYDRQPAILTSRPVNLQVLLSEHPETNTLEGTGQARGSFRPNSTAPIPPERHLAPRMTPHPPSHAHGNSAQMYASYTQYRPQPTLERSPAWGNSVVETFNVPSITISLSSPLGRALQEANVLGFNGENCADFILERLHQHKHWIAADGLADAVMPDAQPTTNSNSSLSTTAQIVPNSANEDASMEQHVNQQHTSNFFTVLPSEIRNTIVELLFSAYWPGPNELLNLISTEHKPFYFNMRPSRPVNFLRTCKLAYNQYIGLLYSRNTFRLGCVNHRMRFFGQIGKRHMELLRKLSVKELKGIVAVLLDKYGALANLIELTLEASNESGWNSTFHGYVKHCGYVARITSRDQGHPQLKIVFQAPTTEAHAYIPDPKNKISLEVWCYYKNRIRIVTTDGQPQQKVRAQLGGAVMTAH